MIEELVQICPYSNWLNLLIKYSLIESYPSADFDEHKLKIVLGTLNIMEKQAQHIEKWSSVISFISQLNHLFKLVESKRIIEGRVALTERMNMGLIERCLMEAGNKC